MIRRLHHAAGYAVLIVLVVCFAWLPVALWVNR